MSNYLTITVLYSLLYVIILVIEVSLLTVEVAPDSPFYLASLLPGTEVFGGFIGDITVGDIRDIFRSGELVDNYPLRSVVVGERGDYCWWFDIYYSMRDFGEVVADKVSIKVYGIDSCNKGLVKPRIPLFSLVTWNRELIPLLIGYNSRSLIKAVDINDSDVLEALLVIPLHLLVKLLSGVSGVHFVTGSHRFTGNILEVVTSLKFDGVKFVSKKGDTIIHTGLVHYPLDEPSPNGLVRVSVLKRGGNVVRSEFTYYYGDWFGVNVSNWEQLGMRMVITNHNLAGLFDFLS